ncbi:hypothetical protein Loa_01087 [Legionella oakridgensis ATCC 33761 = DSM 21215]|uniref:Uncharacterized protein n=2 Tax=Legionella oakridgensis TaxID=29423 RepID=W0B7X3_9GAMM|nr:hypothetical protein Loa_01087 [Legionella oakridgensis ATCC 33761 = DSM 21215]
MIPCYNTKIGFLGCFLIMLNIKRVDDAHLIWRKFNLKYKDLSPGINSERQAHYTRKDVSVDFLHDVAARETEYTEAAQRLQAFWKRLRSKDTLIQVNPKGNHSGDVHHLLNYHPKKNKGVKKSINKRKLDALLAAIDTGNWEYAIFKDATLPQLALSLFGSGKISQQQIYTILERHQTLKDYPLLSDFDILNSDGSFSDAAKKLLLPRLRQRSYLNGLSSEQLEEFRLMIAALPKSEQHFYVTEKGKLKEYRDYRQLGNTLIQLDGILNAGGLLFHLSAGARDALGLATFGLKEYVRPMPRLGQQMLADIEHGVAHRARYAALNYPGTTPYENIHDYQGVNDLEATSHDVYHGNVMSTIPENFLKVLKRFVDISRTHTSCQWSKEIWDWVDNDYVYFFHRYGRTPNTDDIGQSTALLCAMLAYGNGTTTKVVSAGGSLLRLNKPTPLGILIFLDMIKNRSEWLELNIAPDRLTGHFGFYYSLIDELYDEYLKDEEDVRIQVLKIQAYLELQEQGQVQSFKAVNEMIDAEKQNLLSRLEFKKRPKMDTDKFSNTIEFRLDDELITMHSLREMVKNHYHNSHKEVSSSAAEYYAKAVLELAYERAQASVYAHLRQQGETDSHAQFLVKPTLSNWIMDNPWKVVLWSLTLIAIPFILLYGAMQVHYARQNDINLRANITPVVSFAQSESVGDRELRREVPGAWLGAWRESAPAKGTLMHSSIFYQRSVGHVETPVETPVVSFGKTL